MRLTRAAAAAAFAAALYLGCVPYDGAPMQASDDPVTRALRMPDEDYFRIDEERQRRLQDELIVRTSFEGTALGAPGTVDVGRREALPVLWAARSSVLRNWQVQRARNSCVVVSDLVSGRVTAHDVNHGPKKVDFRNVPRSREGAPPAEGVAKGATASTEVLDVRTVANLPWAPGRFAFTLLMHDWRSNTVVTDLVRAGEPSRDPATLRRSVEDSRAVLARIRGRREAVPPTLSVGRTAATPPLPGHGIAIAPPGPAAASDLRWTVHCAFRIDVAPGAVLDPVAAAAAATPASPGPTAVVAVAFLVVQLDRPLPRIAQVEVPVEARLDAPPGGGVAEAAFAADLKADLGVTVPPGEYLLYAAAGEYVAGPVPFVVR